MTQATELDGRRVRGDATRRTVLETAVDLASAQGLDGLSIGRLADAAGQSKSGVASLFGAKERLQLATVAAARERFVRRVVAPARAAHPRGLARVSALVAAWIDYSRSRVFAGGCFFAATSAEFDSKPGAVRDAVVAALDEWDAYLTRSLAAAVDAGDLRGDPARLTFEITALLDAANARSLRTGTSEPYAVAAASVRDRLVGAGAPPESVAAIA